MYPADEKMEARKQQRKQSVQVSTGSSELKRKKYFSIIGNMAFYEASLVLDSFVKDLRKVEKFPELSTKKHHN